MKAIINSEISVVHELETFAKSPYPNSDFSIGRRLSANEVLRDFAENLLLYDKIYIVTTSFEEVITIKNWLGAPNLEELLRNGVIEFVQTPFSWTYIQKWKREKGIHSFNGIATISIADQNAPRIPSLSGGGELSQQSLGGWSSPDLEKAVTYTLTTFHDFNPKKIGKFARTVASHSTQLNSEDFRRFITNKSDEELKNEAVRKALGFSEKIDIENVPDNSDDIRRVFRLIMATQNLAIMNSMPQADLLAEQFYLEALRYPLTNELRKTKLENQADELFAMEKLPSPKILGTELTISDILKIRNSREGIEFRKWIHEHLENGEDVKGAYVELLRREMPFFYRMINTIVFPVISLGTTLVTKLPPIAVDAALGAVTEFKVKSFAEKYLLPNPPKFLMDMIKERRTKSE